MPAVSPANDVLQDASFWKAYFWSEFEDEGDLWGESAEDARLARAGALLGRFPEFRDRPLSFDLPDGYRLILRLDQLHEGPQLYLQHEGRETLVACQAQHGRWDQVFRWDELETLCRCVAENNPTLPHERLPLLLLYRFAALGYDDDVPRAFVKLREAWEGLGVLSNERVERLLRWCDGRARHLEWQEQPELGWTLYDRSPWAQRAAQKPAGTPTARTPERQFPFADFNQMLARVRRTAEA